MSHVLMPALSPTMEAGGLARWCVGPGDPVQIGDVIAEIETDKAVLELEATQDGVIAEILVPAGAEGVAVGAPIARLAAPGDDARLPVLSPAARRIVTERDLDPAGIAGTGRDGRITKADALAAAPLEAPDAEASPLARRIARLTGRDLSAVSGSGPGGRIVAGDLIDHADQGPEAPRPPAPVQAAGQLVRLDPMRATIARRMTESFRDTPHFPLSIDVEVDALAAARGRINAAIAETGLRISLNDLILKASAVALRQVPEANASFTPQGIVLHHSADIAMAVALEGGLITPIIRQAETKGVAQIAAEARELAARARERRLRPEEHQGGTFTVSNLGMFGVRSFSSILNAPHGCILSVGAAEPRPVVRGEALAIATVMSLTLTCDHRVVDGAVGARWLAVLRGLIAEPLALIL